MVTSYLVQPVSEDQENWFNDLPIRGEDTTEEEFLKELEEYREQWREKLHESKNEFAKNMGLDNDNPILNYHILNIDKQTNELLDFYAKQGELPSYLTDKNNGVVNPFNPDHIILGMYISVTKANKVIRSVIEVSKNAKKIDIIISKSRKIRQMDRQGWSKKEVEELVNKPFTTRKSTNKEKGNSATVYYNKRGNYVTRDDVTGELVQVSNKFDADWVPDSEIVDHYVPKGD